MFTNWENPGLQLLGKKIPIMICLYFTQKIGAGIES